jgi:1,4-alpha-glucan branching enzyme
MLLEKIRVDSHAYLCFLQIDLLLGLGFDAKWDLGWMQDTLSYLYTPVHERPKFHQKLTFRGLYAANERWILPLSHDEVVHGKGSILDKCGYYSTDFQIKLHTLRSLFTFQIGLAARPLIFMGTEFGQGREWRSHISLDWHEASEPLRIKLFHWLRDVLYLYCHEPALQPRKESSLFSIHSLSVSRR